MSHVFSRRTHQGTQLLCSICRVAAVPQDELQAQRFLHEHEHPVQPVDPRFYGAGDLVARATGALGIEQCSPCQERQRRLNAILPRVLRR